MPISDRWYMHPKDCQCPECRMRRQQQRHGASKPINTKPIAQPRYYCDNCKRIVEVDIVKGLLGNKTYCTYCGNKVKRIKG